ncbi:Uma2 family endonuclease [Eubacterium sp. 1001713B170207_170306_E7]|uniref:Uma2 family endonuclease n=1 Tax=Eubacterium sp. 1001713B170207_170306_E7 TaxID=2787097 RepID=UPI001899686F|nr:Uma2 family endonuclease [Eubacterium sp. 1001713B170207_170306_E7]
MPLLKEDYTEKPISLEEFEKLPADEQKVYELIDGMVMMTPRPNVAHHDISGNLYFALKTYLTGKQCKVYNELEIRLNKDVLVPDLSVLCDPDKFTDQRYEGPPAIVIEILSPATYRNDLFVKLNKYQLAGVREYWIVNPKVKAVTVHYFEHETAAEFTAEDTLESKVFEDLSVSLKAVFE